MYLPCIVYISRIILYKWSYAQLYLKHCSLRIHGALICNLCNTERRVESINREYLQFEMCINSVKHMFIHVYTLLFVISF